MSYLSPLTLRSWRGSIAASTRVVRRAALAGRAGSVARTGVVHRATCGAVGVVVHCATCGVVGAIAHIAAEGIARLSALVHAVGGRCRSIADGGVVHAPIGVSLLVGDGHIGRGRHGWLVAVGIHRRLASHEVDGQQKARQIEYNLLHGKKVVHW